MENVGTQHHKYAKEEKYQNSWAKEEKDGCKEAKQPYTQWDERTSHLIKTMSFL